LPVELPSKEKRQPTSSSPSHKKSRRRSRVSLFGLITVGMEIGAIARLPRLDPDVASLLSPFVRGPFVA